MAGSSAEVEGAVDSLAWGSLVGVVEVGHMGHTMDNILAVGGIGDEEEVPAVEEPAVGVRSSGEAEGEQEVAVLAQL